MASAVTASDIFIRSAHVSARLQVPFRLMMGVTKPRHPILGFVFSGVIDQVGAQTSRFAPGDAVYGGTGFRLGAYAEYRCMIETDSRTHGTLALKPTNLTHEAGDRCRLRRPARTPVRRQGTSSTRARGPHLRRVRHLRNDGHPVRQVPGSACHRRLQHEEPRPRQISRRRRGTGLHPHRRTSPGCELRSRPGLRRRTEVIAAQAGLPEGPCPRRQVRLHRRRQFGTEFPTAWSSSRPSSKPAPSLRSSGRPTRWTASSTRTGSSKPATSAAESQSRSSNPRPTSEGWGGGHEASAVRALRARQLTPERATAPGGKPCPPALEHRCGTRSVERGDWNPCDLSTACPTCWHPSTRSSPLRRPTRGGRQHRR